LEKLHLYSYLAGDIFELIKSSDKLDIPISKNIAAAKFFIVGKTRMDPQKKLIKE
tara:strand:+ start:820 stop:984 length:165 start_codon:yes stop_codon:yes gene_type:complete